ncbi:sterile alpha motif domain-containing protein 9-like [Betta splendens]|uniref:Sterile alpha motif domain-containing protein 9-like n=1 Tax=Betta splendens TaxID=158456 RepID=A0A9W2XKQ8_BETSP|nr:sterile alpha motif domain-containing protein 9-like [Betta splendens]
MEQAATITEEHTVLGAIKAYVEKNPESTNTQLFSFLALLSAYLPKSYLLKSECKKILGSPDPIDERPPFEERMKPFIALINLSGNAECRCSLHAGTAQKALELLAELGFTRSEIVQNFIRLNFEYYRPHVVEYVKDLLTKRKISKKKKEQFSRLITDIKNKENPHNTVSVLETASDIFDQNPTFPQTIARLYYQSKTPDYDQAKWWALEAIERAPHNSYVADTLGQICKNRLIEADTDDVICMADEAFEAFKDVEEKAEWETGPGTKHAVSNSKSFNNRGRFGFIQVAKIAFERYPDSQKQSLIQNKQTKVEENFVFFEWYLTYSTPDMKTLEPWYFWKDVALCYKHYAKSSSADSTSFAGLLDLLNHGLQMSKGRRAGFNEVRKEVSELEKIQDVLKRSYEANPDSVDDAQRYILSNIILSNMEPDSAHITQMTELKKIISRFLKTDVGRRRPEFYLLVLLLFWPEQNQNVILDLEMYATYMERAFEKKEHAKYLRGRYLLPLFFLGKGSGLSKWIHKSKLDAIVENQDVGNQRKKWEIPKIHDMLLPVMVEPCHSLTTPQEQQNPKKEVFVCVGDKKIKATTEGKAEVQIDSSNRFYLGFTIRGPIVFKVKPPHKTDSSQTRWGCDKPQNRNRMYVDNVPALEHTSLISQSKC